MQNAVLDGAYLSYADILVRIMVNRDSIHKNQRDSIIADDSCFRSRLSATMVFAPQGPRSLAIMLSRWQGVSADHSCRSRVGMLAIRGKSVQVVDFS